MTPYQIKQHNQFTAIIINGISSPLNTYHSYIPRHSKGYYYYYYYSKDLKVNVFK